MAASRKRNLFILRVVLLSVASMLFIATAASGPPCQEASLSPSAEILKKAAAYCRVFGGATLNYTCIEDVRETAYFPYLRVPRPPDERFRIKNNHFVYDFQLVKVGGKITEQRNLLEEDGVRKNAAAGAPRMGWFSYQLIILGPMILSDYWQPYHDYKMAGRGKVGDEECVIIDAVPKPSAPPGHLFGKVWVREQDGRILKLEWDQQSIQNYELIVATAKELKAKPRIKLTMEYSFEKNGIGFPSRCRVSETYATIEREFRLILSETTINYKNYKFFSVETEVSAPRPRK